MNHFLSKIRPIAEEFNISLVQLVLSWTIHQSGIAVALGGARTAEQVEENAHAADIELSSSQIKTINEHLNDLDFKFE